MIGHITYVENFGGPRRLVMDPTDLKKDLRLLILWGGEDVHPKMYGQKKGPMCGPTDIERDKRERSVLIRAQQMGIPVLGICKGAQTLCVFNDGKLWQHVEGHAGGEHGLIMIDGTYHRSNSAHHQMVIPDLEADVIGWADTIQSPYKYGEKDEPVRTTSMEPEIVYYPQNHSLGIQGHPEWLPAKHDLVVLTHKLVKECLNANLA